MKLDCKIIKDLLPLYVEKMTSDESNRAIEEHLADCEACKNYHKELVTPTTPTVYDVQPAKNFKTYVKKEKRRGIIAAIIAAGVAELALLGILIRFVLPKGAVLALLGTLIIDSALTPVKADYDVANYANYMGETALEEYQWKPLADDIFPEVILDSYNVKDYAMIYYNPWDPQYLSYLTIEYNDADYKEELARLDTKAIDDYYGVYSATGFHNDYKPLALYCNDYGYVYALAGEENTITYVEILFCNYYMDLDYEKYIDIKLLPVGFDAEPENPTAYEIQRKREKNDELYYNH